VKKREGLGPTPNVGEFTDEPYFFSLGSVVKMGRGERRGLPVGVCRFV
jgi:hypothetical protein